MFEHIKRATPFKDLPFEVVLSQMNDESFPLEAVLPMSVMHNGEKYNVYGLLHDVKLPDFEKFLPEPPQVGIDELKFNPKIRVSMPLVQRSVSDLRRIRVGDILLSEANSDAIAFDFRLEEHHLFSATFDSEGQVIANQA